MTIRGENMDFMDLIERTVKRLTIPEELSEDLSWFTVGDIYEVASVNYSTKEVYFRRPIVRKVVELGDARKKISCI